MSDSNKHHCATCGHDESMCTPEEFYLRVTRYIGLTQKCNLGMLQRDLKVSYVKVVRIVERLEDEGLLRRNDDDGRYEVLFTLNERYMVEMKPTCTICGHDMYEMSLEKIYECVTEYLKDKHEFKISDLQQDLRIGYAKAATVADLLETKGLVGPYSVNGGTRKVLLN